jgi:hypothetical protein
MSKSRDQHGFVRQASFKSDVSSIHGNDGPLVFPVDDGGFSITSSEYDEYSARGGLPVMSIFTPSDIYARNHFKTTEAVLSATFPAILKPPPRKKKICQAKNVKKIGIVPKSTSSSSDDSKELLPRNSSSAGRFVGSQRGSHTVDLGKNQYKKHYSARHTCSTADVVSDPFSCSVASSSIDHDIRTINELQRDDDVPILNNGRLDFHNIGCPSGKDEKKYANVVSSSFGQYDAWSLDCSDDDSVYSYINGLQEAAGALFVDDRDGISVASGNRLIKKPFQAVLEQDCVRVAAGTTETLAFPHLECSSRTAGHVLEANKQPKTLLDDQFGSMEVHRHDVAVGSSGAFNSPNAIVEAASASGMLSDEVDALRRDLAEEWTQMWLESSRGTVRTEDNLYSGVQAGENSGSSVAERFAYYYFV